MDSESDDNPFTSEPGEDMNGVFKDNKCDDDKLDVEALEAAGNCTIPGKDRPAPWQLFADVGQIEFSEVVQSTLGDGDDYGGGGGDHFAATYFGVLVILIMI